MESSSSVIYVVQIRGSFKRVVMRESREIGGVPAL